MQIEPMCVVYQAVNVVNGHRYIGITRKGLDRRVRRHYWTACSGRGAAIGAAIRKYGKDNIQFSTLIVCPSFEYAKEMEIAAITAYTPEYNLTKGGDGTIGLKLSEAAKARIRDSQIGNSHWLGKTHRDESKEKIRRSRLSGKGGPRKGTKYHLTDEDLSRRIERIGRARSKLVGRKLPAEQIEKFCLAGSIAMSKQVICTNTGEMFPSLIGLSRVLKCDRRRLRTAIVAGAAFSGLTYEFAA